MINSKYHGIYQNVAELVAAPPKYIFWIYEQHITASTKSLQGNVLLRQQII